MNCINCNNISLNTRNTYFATQLLRLIDNNNKNKSQHSFDLRLGVQRIFQCEKSKQDFPVRSEVSIDKINVNWLATLKQMIMHQMITNECTSIICFFATPQFTSRRVASLHSQFSIQRPRPQPKSLFQIFLTQVFLKIRYLI